jgi:Ran GTPase-activating protein (RanGAP) involved in mRNA processing and transport
MLWDVLAKIQTVQVTNVSSKATQHDLKEFFSFSGEIQHIELEKDGGGSQVAYVTFKDAQALDTALLLSVSLYRHTGICLLY